MIKYFFPERPSFFSLVQMVSVMYLMVWSVAPPFQIDMIYRLAAVGCAGVWFVIEFINHFEFNNAQIASLVFLAMYVIVSYYENGGSFSEVLGGINLLMLILGFVMAVYYEDRWLELRPLLPVVFILLIIFNIRTINALATNAAIARLIVRNDANMEQYIRQGIGGYGLIYTQVCFFPAGLAWVMKMFQKNKILFALGAGWVGTYLVLISNAGYSIAIFTTVASVAIMIMYRKESFFAALILAVGVFGAAWYSIVYMEGFRNLLVQFFDGTKVVKKINDLVASSESGAAEGSIGDRMNSYSNSLKVIAQYPVIGSLARGSGGGHSAILDVFAKYGVFGGAVYCMMLFQKPQRMKKHANRFGNSVANATMISICIIGMLNSFPYQIMYPIVILVPLFLEDILSMSGDEYENSLDG